MSSKAADRMARSPAREGPGRTRGTRRLRGSALSRAGTHASWAGAMLLVSVVCLGSVAAVASARPAGPASFSVSLSDTPSVADPQQVTFTATVLSGTPTGFNWSFGDGQYLNGTTLAYANPVHRYEAPGTFNVSVVVTEGTTVSSQWLVLTILPAPFEVSIDPRTVGGPAPLTVQFTALIHGGTGTYRSVVWEFGDGGSGVGTPIDYTYSNPGHYLVTLNVTDKSGAFTLSQSWVNVTANTSLAANSTDPPSSAMLEGLLAGAALGIAFVVGGVRWFRRDRRASPPADPGDGTEPATVPAGPGQFDVPVNALAALAVAGSPALSAGPPGSESASSHPSRPAQPEGPGPNLSIPASPPSTRSDEAVPTARPAEFAEALRNSHRIVLHLARLPRVGPTEIPPVGYSQIGISRELHVRQNNLTNVLRRLVAAGVLDVEVRHVQGQARRLKVYQLTARGEALARDLRLRESRAKATAGPAPASSGPAPAEP